MTNRLGHGSMIGAVNKEEVGELTGWMEDTVVEGDCASVWTPLSDQDEEGVYRDLASGEVVDTLAWAPGQPNGAGTQNSVRIITATNVLEDIEDEQADCFACLLQRSFAVQLRGGCKDSILERQFYIINKKGGSVSYQGFFGSSITYRTELGIWEARHHTQTGFRAWAKASAASLFLGPNLWTIEGDSPQCSTNDTYSSRVLLTGCNNTEFSCRSRLTQYPHVCLNCCTGREAAYR